MKLSNWAKEKGISYKTAYRMYCSGKLPIESEQLATGTILVYPTKHSGTNDRCVLYARVSSYDQKQDLERQLNRLQDYAASKGLNIVKEVTEIGSGLNGNRKKLNSILSDSSLTTIIIEHRDRLARFGVEMLSLALKSSGRRILILNETEYKNDIIQDFVDLVVSMCARIYGKRGSRNRAERIIKEVSDES